MARLNEPPMPMESNLDILRRKFLRQNRDLAKVNSNQSNRIRTLENECARLLSENLDLRGQVMRLEKELENNHTDRIADHAMEIKAKMEAQLAEWGAMLASLGTEPPSKRHSPERRRGTKPSQKGLRSPAQRRSRETTVDPETLAAKEGRLPPIYENKSYPRATMSSEQILALCAEAADSTNSPDIGPPPVSRFVDEDMVKSNSPASVVGNTEPRVQTEGSRKEVGNSTPLPKLDYERKASSNSSPFKDPDSVPTKMTKSEREEDVSKTAAPVLAVSAAKSGAKRKYGDENDSGRTAKVQAGKENANPGLGAADKNIGGVQKVRNIKELPASKKKAQSRPPLSAKSTNNDVSSPKKAPRVEAAKASKPQPQNTAPNTAPGDAPTSDRERQPAIEPKPEVPSPPGPIPSVVTIPPELAVLDTPAMALISPDTPDRSAPRDPALDTPPPGHISADGETSRPSRRARAAISYAEPNLRDKMRRPTKELFDAVSGEGKFKARASLTAVPGQRGDESAPTSVSRSGSGGGANSTYGQLTAEGAAARESILSPLAQKEPPQSLEALPSSVVQDRKKRPSAVGGDRESLAAPREKSSDAPDLAKPKATAVNKPVESMDIYDFASSSPATSSKTRGSPSEEAKPKRQARRASAAAHQALREYAASASGDSPVKEPAQPTRQRPSGQSRKRASMLAPKRPAMMDLLEGDYHDNHSTSSSVGGGDDGAAAAVNDKISRRRSMML